MVEINPGSNEFALKIEDALKAIELLKDTKIAILGGDILSEQVDKLIYAYQLWGSEYHCLNWFCDKTNNENQEEYAIRSYQIAIESINTANKVAKHIEKNCYVVIVL